VFFYGFYLKLVLDIILHLEATILSIFLDRAGGFEPIPHLFPPSIEIG
jgi:hypothetical protein